MILTPIIVISALLNFTIVLVTFLLMILKNPYYESDISNIEIGDWLMLLLFSLSAGCGIYYLTPILLCIIISCIIVKLIKKLDIQ